jgi:NADPH:quinone reductase-like Zn-dependent oxidoreductase
MKVYSLDPVGTLDGLKLGDEEERRPGPKEVAIRIRATSLNYRDLKVATGAYERNAIKPRVIPLSDGAGEVVEAGPDEAHCGRDCADAGHRRGVALRGAVRAHGRGARDCHLGQ